MTDKMSLSNLLYVHMPSLKHFSLLSKIQYDPKSIYSKVNPLYCRSYAVICLCCLSLLDPHTVLLTQGVCHSFPSYPYANTNNDMIG